MIKYAETLETGILLKRYKRFLSDIRLDSGTQIVAHVPNTGSMLSTRDPGSRVAVSYHPDPKRKLKWTLELVESSGSWVGVNTAFSNRIVEAAVLQHLIPELDGYDTLRREVKYGSGSRIDLLLESSGRKCYVEVKNVTYRHADAALFPDAVTVRGTRHLRELCNMVKEGHAAVMFFLVNRDDCRFMAPATEIDPTYSQTLVAASAAGVQLMAYAVHHTLQGCNIDRPIPVRLPSMID